MLESYWNRQCLDPLLVAVADLDFDVQTGIFKVWVDSEQGIIILVPP